MSLIVALNTARSSLANTAKQLAVSGRNITGANDPNYTRKSADTVTSADGGAHIISIARATDSGIFARVLGAKSSTTARQAVLDGLERLQDTVGDTDAGTSPAARIAALSQALQTAANSPSDRSLAQAAVTAAQAAASTLNSATATVTSIRTDADTAMAASVAKINDLLAKFTDLNAAVVRGTFTGDDVTDLQDQRDGVLGQLSQEIGISTVQRPNNDIAIFTDGGVPLFDKQARTVSFQTSTSLPAGTTGNAVIVDGVPVTGDNATMPLISGKLAGLATLRDDVTVSYQNQLDEMARGLIEATAESDQSGGGGADKAGLFTYSGGPAIPATGTLVPGLAGLIKVTAAVDPAQGGSLDKVRDGGINGANYSYNLSAAVGFSDRLQGLVDALDAPRTFDTIAGLESGQPLTDFSVQSVSWLENLRKTTSADVDYQNTLLSRTSDALANVSGVNVDDEYAKQLQLEQSYQASSKLINVVQQMFDSLLAAMP